MFFLFRSKKIFLLLFVSVSLICIDVAAQFYLTGTPQIVNFAKNTYNADSRNWSISQTSNGILYFGNGDGLLSFNGSKWNLNRLPDNQIIRAVAVDQNNRIYTGGYGEFGYWQATVQGLLRYHSLNHLVDKNIFKKEEIWKISPTSEGVFFQSFSQLYRLQDNKVSSVSFPGNIMMLFSIRGKDYIQVLEHGLFIINKNNSVAKVEGSDIFNDKKIISIIPFINNSILIGTVKHGLFIYDGFTFKSWNAEANNFIIQNNLNAGLQLDDNHYTFGTLQNGILISDAQGKILHHINRQSGLQNNTVLSLHKDLAGNIVAGLDNGIDYIVINSGLTFFKDNLGKLGASYTAQLYNSNLYIGSNHGLFSTKVEKVNPFQVSAINKVNNVSEQVWSLNKIDNRLLCGNNNATYKVLANSAEKISSVPGGWVIEKLKINNNYLIQGSYIGVALYDKDSNGSWRMLKLLDSSNNIPSKKIIQDEKGNIWIEHVNKGIFYTQVDANLNAKKIEPITIKNTNLANNKKAHLFSLHNKVCIESDNKIYSYTASENAFTLNDSLTRKLKTYLPFNKLIEEENTVWIVRDNHTIVVLTPKLDMIKETISWKQSNFSMINDYENIVKLTESLYIICGEEGFIAYDNYYTNPINYRPKLFIDNIAVWNGHTYQYDSTHTDKKFSNKQNGVKIAVAFPSFDSEIKYRYSISNNDESLNWSEWTDNSEREFHNLPSSKYYIKIQSNQSDEIVQYNFSILRPWYASIVAIILYFLLFCAICYFIYQYVKRKVDKQNEYIRLQHERKLLEEKRKFERLTMLKHQEELEKEVIIKNEDVAKSAMKLIKNRKALQKLKTEINKLKTEHANDSSNFQIQKLAKQLDRLIQDDQEERNLFENGFSKVHEEFFKRLLTRYPKLTSQDLKLAAYLRMNLSSKEIAPLLDISVRGVEIKRYRLRKRLNIESETNLNDFMMKF